MFQIYFFKNHKNRTFIEQSSTNPLFGFDYVLNNIVQNMNLYALGLDKGEYGLDF